MSDNIRVQWQTLRSDLTITNPIVGAPPEFELFKFTGLPNERRLYRFGFRNGRLSVRNLPVGFHSVNITYITPKFSLSAPMSGSVPTPPGGGGDGEFTYFGVSAFNTLSFMYDKTDGESEIIVRARFFFPGPPNGLLSPGEATLFGWVLSDPGSNNAADYSWSCALEDLGPFNNPLEV